MTRKVIQTKDNSKTLLITENDDTYHSIHGALTESNHVFIKHGLKSSTHQNELRIFEMGFGTGLNCMLTLDYAIKENLTILYHTIEIQPVTPKEISELEYESLFPPAIQSYFNTIHTCSWNEQNAIHPNFTIKKIQSSLLQHHESSGYFDLVYFDAFGPKSQPELWETEVMNKMFEWLKPGGTIITYCAQGQFKRNLKAAGFTVENLPGPPGKREITRGIKPLI